MIFYEENGEKYEFRFPGGARGNYEYWEYWEY